MKNKLIILSLFLQCSCEQSPKQAEIADRDQRFTLTTFEIIAAEKRDSIATVYLIKSTESNFQLNVVSDFKWNIGDTLVLDNISKFSR